MCGVVEGRESGSVALRRALWSGQGSLEGRTASGRFQPFVTGGGGAEENAEETADTAADLAAVLPAPAPNMSGRDAKYLYARRARMRGDREDVSMSYDT